MLEGCEWGRLTSLGTSEPSWMGEDPPKPQKEFSSQSRRARDGNWRTQELILLSLKKIAQQQQKRRRRMIGES